MITSEDVRRVTFDRALRGYRCEDVDDYLKQVADSMDAISAQSEELQKKLEILAQRIEQYRADEDTLRTTMINAQRLGENVIHEAKQKAAEIIRAANIKAEDREQHSRDEVELYRQEIVTLKKEADEFKKNLIGLYRTHLNLLSKLPEYHPEEDAPPMSQQPLEPKEMSEVMPPEPSIQPPVVSSPASSAVQPEPQAEVGYMPSAFEDSAFYEEPAVDAQTPLEEEKIDTVEFAIAPQSEEPQKQPVSDLQDSVPEARFSPGAGLYDDVPQQEPPAKKPARRKPRAKRAVQPPAEDLPASFDKFEGVDFDS